MDRLAVAELVGRRVAVIRPHLFQVHRLVGNAVEGLEGVAHAVRAAEENKGLVADLPQRGRRPLAVKEPRADLLVLRGQQAAGSLVQGDQGGGVGRDDLLVRLVHAVGGADVQNVAVDQHRAAGGVVRAYPEFVDQVITPNHLGVGRRRVPCRLGRGRIRLPVDVQTHHLVGAGDQINAIAVHGGRGAGAQILMVEIGGWLQVGPFRRDQLPQQFARGLVQAFHHSASVGRIARFRAERLAVGPDEDAAAGDRRIAIGVVAQSGGPLDVLGRGEVDYGGRLSSPGMNESGKGFSSETMLRPSSPPQCGQSPAQAGEPPRTTAMPNQHAKTERLFTIENFPHRSESGPGWPPDKNVVLKTCPMGSIPSAD